MLCEQNFRLFVVPYYIQFTHSFIHSAHTLSICRRKALEKKVDLIPLSMGMCQVEDST